MRVTPQLVPLDEGCKLLRLGVQSRILHKGAELLLRSLPDALTQSHNPSRREGTHCVGDSGLSDLPRLDERLEDLSRVGQFVVGMFLGINLYL